MIGDSIDDSCAYLDGRSEERALIVRWLRANSDRILDYICDNASEVRSSLEIAADELEKGERLE